MQLRGDKREKKIKDPFSVIQYQDLYPQCEDSKYLNDEMVSDILSEDEYRGLLSKFEVPFKDEEIYRSYYQQFFAMLRGGFLLNDYKVPGHLLPPSENTQSTKWSKQEQPQFATLPRYNNPKPEQLRMIANHLCGDKGDLSYFWYIQNNPDRDQYLQGLEFIVAPLNWPLQRYQYQKIFDKFLNAFSRKIQGASFLDKLYPGLQRVLRKIQMALEWKRGGGCQVSERSAMTFYQFFIREIQSKYQQKGGFYIRDEKQSPVVLKMPISDYISNSPYFKGNDAWIRIFQKAAFEKIFELQTKFQKQGNQGQTQAQMRMNRGILTQRALKGQDILIAINHLCCATFFYYNYSIFYDRKVSQCPVLAERQFIKLWQEPQVGKQTQVEKTMIDICALLNNGGGVILFNTFKIYLQLCPKGEAMQRASFEKAKNLIKQQIRNIYPPVYIDQHIKVNFVPMVRNPITDGLPNEGRRSYIEGLYVMRIVVKPDNKGQQVYFYSKQPRISFCVPIMVGDSTCILRRSRPARYIKQRVAQYYVSQNDYNDQIQRDMLKKSCYKFTYHQQCKKPQEGKPLQKLILRDKLEGAILEKNYKHLTLLVTGVENHPIFRQKLKGRNIDCEILVKYTNYGFKGANNSAALFHNVPFTKILEEVAFQKDFEYNGRFALTILVTPYIRLMDRNIKNPMAQQQFNNLSDWLHKQHPKEHLEMWKYEDGQIVDFFMKTQSKLSSLFMYFVLNAYNEKSQFKNPKNLHQQNNNLTLIYPRRKEDSPDQKKGDGSTRAKAAKQDSK